MGNPLGGGLERLRVQAAAAHAAVFLMLDEAGAVEHTQVLGHRGQRHAEGLRQFADGCFAPREAGQDSAAGGVGEGAKGGVKSGGL